MAYMVSGSDDYWVNPTHPQVLTYALVDPYFINGYVCQAVKDLEEAWEQGRDFQKCLRSMPHD